MKWPPKEAKIATAKRNFLKLLATLGHPACLLALSRLSMNPFGNGPGQHHVVSGNTQTNTKATLIFKAARLQGFSFVSVIRSENGFIRAATKVDWTLWGDKEENHDLTWSHFLHAESVSLLYFFFFFFFCVRVRTAVSLCVMWTSWFQSQT